MYYILLKDEGQLVLSSHKYDEYEDALAYLKTIAPSREPMIVGFVSGIRYDEATGDYELEHGR